MNKKLSKALGLTFVITLVIAGLVISAILLNNYGVINLNLSTDVTLLPQALEDPYVYVGDTKVVQTSGEFQTENGDVAAAQEAKSNLLLMVVLLVIILVLLVFLIYRLHREIQREKLLNAAKVV